MARTTSDAFWPSGAVDEEAPFSFPSLGSDSSSLVSPIALPQGATGYFDQAMATFNPATQVSSASQVPARGVRRSRVYSPLSPGARGPALPQFLSPHLGPIVAASSPQHRSTSLPPTRRDRSMGPATRHRTNTASTPSGVSGFGPAQSFLHAANRPAATISVESPDAPSQAQMMRRLVQQNARIREAWEAERKYMEANRERVEEVYKEERALMEDERCQWEAEKARLLQKIRRLQNQVLALGGNLERHREDSITAPRYVPPESIRGGGNWEISSGSVRSSLSSQENDKHGMPGARNAVSLPNTGVDPKSFRTAPASELAAVPEVEAAPIPVVDVQEIHPDLEGIPIKATVLQPTFTDSPSHSPQKAPSAGSSPPGPNPTLQLFPSGGLKEKTLRVLAAEESVRLIMHAGHTPSHSFFIPPTVTSSGVHTASSGSGDSTPKLLQVDGLIPQAMPSVHQRPGPPPLDLADPLSEYHTEPEAVWEPEDDRELKGPLMVRNMPAHDEIFFRRLSDKLEEVVRGDQAALPAVLKDVDQQGESMEQMGPNPVPVAPQAESQAEGQSASPGSNGPGSEGGSSSPKSNEGDVEVPLKFKSSLNFGAPLGTFR